MKLTLLIKIILVIFLAWTPCSLWAEVYEDYLEEHLLKEGIIMINNSDIEGALQTLQEGLNLSKERKNNFYVVKFFRNIGNVYKLLGKDKEALFNYKESLRVSRETGDRENEEKSLRDIGTLYEKLEKYTEAIRNYKESLEIATEIEDINGMGESLVRIGISHGKLGNFRTAPRFFKVALKIARDGGDRRSEMAILENLGITKKELNQHNEALDYFEKALRVAKELGNKSSEGANFENMGLIYSDLGNYRNARMFFEKSLKIYRDVGNRKGESISLVNIGNVYSNLGEYGKAISTFNEALEISEEIGYRQGEAVSLINIGIVNNNRADYLEAHAAFKEALTISRDIGDRNSIGTILGNIGIINKNFGDFPEALNNFEKSLKVKIKVKDKAGEANTLENIGLLHSDQGNFPKALEYLNKSLEIARKIGDKKGESISLVNIGNVYSNLGEYAKAVSKFEEALKISKEIGYRKGEEASQGSIGIVYNNLGDYFEAQSHYEKAKSIAVQIGDKRGEGIALGNMGLVHRDLGNYGKALESYKGALKIEREIGVPSYITEGNIGDIYLELRDFNAAYEIYKKLDHTIRLGLYYLKQNDFSDALDEFKRSLDWEEDHLREEPLLALYIGIGLAYEGLGKCSDAETYFQKAISFKEDQISSLITSQKGNYFSGKVFTLSRIEAYEGLARVYNNCLNNPDKALFYSENTKARLFLEAIAAQSSKNIFRIPEDTSNEEKRLLTQVASTYKQMDKAFQAENMDRYNELKSDLSSLKTKIKNFVSRLRKKHPEYASIKYPEPIPTGEIALREDELLIEYEVMEKETYIWVLQKNRNKESGKTSTDIKSMQVQISRRELEKLVVEYIDYFKKIETPDDLSAFDPSLGKELFTLLLKKPLEGIPESKKVIIVPDEILGILPFESLIMEVSDKFHMKVENERGDIGPVPTGISYVDDKYGISYYQSAAALTITRNLKRDSSATKELLVVADPIFNETDPRFGNPKISAKQKIPTTPMMEEFKKSQTRAIKMAFRPRGKGDLDIPRLASTSVLASKLENLYKGGTDTLIGFDASEDNFKSLQLDSYRKLLFATHGILDDEVAHIREPALILTLVNKENNDDTTYGFLTMTEVMNLSFNADVAALTACNTGVGKNITGEGVMGLGRAFQYAGVKSVLMSLWFVEDLSTNLLAERFFVYLKEGKDRLKALRLARKDLRHEGYKHPYYWAPFILVGER